MDGKKKVVNLLGLNEEKPDKNLGNLGLLRIKNNQDVKSDKKNRIGFFRAIGEGVVGFAEWLSGTFDDSRINIEKEVKKEEGIVRKFWIYAKYAPKLFFSFLADEIWGKENENAIAKAEAEYSKKKQDKRKAEFEKQQKADKKLQELKGQMEKDPNPGDKKESVEMEKKDNGLIGIPSSGKGGKSSDKKNLLGPDLYGKNYENPYGKIEKKPAVNKVFVNQKSKNNPKEITIR